MIYLVNFGEPVTSIFVKKSKKEYIFLVSLRFCGAKAKYPPHLQHFESSVKFEKKLLIYGGFQGVNLVG